MSDDRYRLYQQPFPTGDYSYVQLAFAVDDVVATARRWAEVQGVGPFFVIPDRPSTVRYSGAETQLHIRIAVSQAGPLQIELIQQLSQGPSVFRDLYGPNEVGVHHFCAMTHDYDRSVAHYAGCGYEVVAEQDVPGLGRVAFVDTSADFAMMTEVVEWSDGFLTMLSKTARVCANWDGTDPVRIMRVSGGYDSA